MPGLGTVKIVVDNDMMAYLIRHLLSSDGKELREVTDLVKKMNEILPYDAVLLEIVPSDRGDRTMTMIWTHPSFASEPLPDALQSPEPKIPDSWDYAR